MITEWIRRSLKIGKGLFLISIFCLGFTVSGQAAVGWLDEFEADANPPSGWGTYQTQMISVSTGSGFAYITTTAGNNWGIADSPDITLDTDVYPTLEVAVTDLNVSLGFRIAIEHGATTTFLGGYDYSPGIKFYDYVTAVRAVDAGWTGTQTFKVRVFIEAPSPGCTATLDYIKITGVLNTPTYTMTASPTETDWSPTHTPTITLTPTISATSTISATVTHTPTITFTPTISATSTISATVTHTSTITLTPTISATSTPTPTSTNGLTEQIAWQAEFNSSEAPPTGWSANQVNMSSSAGTGYAYVTLNANNWGNADSMDINLNVNDYPILEISVPDINFGLSWRVAIGYTSGTITATEYLNAFDATSGVNSFNYASICQTFNPSWTGIQTFKVRVFIEAENPEPRTVSIDYIRIKGSAIPTPTPIPSDGWVEEFSDPGVSTACWSLTGVTLTVESDIGTVRLTESYNQDTNPVWPSMISETIYVDVDTYSYLVMNTRDVDPNGSAQCTVKIREIGNENNPVTLSPNITQEGVLAWDLKTITGWSGTKRFDIYLGIGSTVDDKIELDGITITDTIPTATPTPIITDNYIRPGVNLFLPKRAPLKIYCGLQDSTRVKLKVFNMAGRLVRTLQDKELTGAVIGEVEWDGKNGDGDFVASGVYIIRIESSSFSKNIRVAVVK
ncbi:hypothetical protein KAR34_06950 [bacterium]|nr:hypothetical protein [bacterium]